MQTSLGVDLTRIVGEIPSAVADRDDVPSKFRSLMAMSVMIAGDVARPDDLVGDVRGRFTIAVESSDGDRRLYYLSKCSGLIPIPTTDHELLRQVCVAAHVAARVAQCGVTYDLMWASRDDPRWRVAYETLRGIDRIVDPVPDPSVGRIPADIVAADGIPMDGRVPWDAIKLATRDDGRGPARGGLLLVGPDGATWYVPLAQHAQRAGPQRRVAVDGVPVECAKYVYGLGRKIEGVELFLVLDACARDPTWTS